MLMMMMLKISLVTSAVTLTFVYALGDPRVTQDASGVSRYPGRKRESEREEFVSLESRQIIERKSHVILRDQTYLVMASKEVKAGQVYRLVTNVLHPSSSLVVRATIFRDNVEIAAVERECDSADLQVLELMMPQGINPGEFQLRIEGWEPGGLRGSAFVNYTHLSLSYNRPNLLVETDKPVYMQGDTVRFRIIAVDKRMRMIEDSVDVYLLSPQGVLVRRWLSRQCLKGAVSLSYPLSKEQEEGTWHIRVESTHASVQHPFVVEFFSPPRFEIDVQIPASLSMDAGYLTGVVVANYRPSGAPLTGNITLTAYTNPSEPSRRPHARVTRPNAMFSGAFPFKFRLSDLAEFKETEQEKEREHPWEVRVEARVGDIFHHSAQTGFAVCRVFRSDIKLEFLGGSPQILHPSMPFKFYLSAQLYDGSEVPAQRLARHRLLVTPEVRMFAGSQRKLQPRTLKMTNAQLPVWEAELELRAELPDIDVSHELESLRLEAELKDSEGMTTRALLIAVVHQSPRGRHLQVTTSTKNPKVGEYVILHVRSNFYLDKFRYILLSKGAILEAGQLSMEASLRTFPLTLTAETAGHATVLIYTAGSNQELVVDSLTFPVEALSHKDFNVSIQQDQEEDMLMVSVSGQPGSKVWLTGSDFEAYRLQAGNVLGYSKVVQQLWGTDNVISPQSKIVPIRAKWTPSEGLPQILLHLPRASPGLDPSSTFANADLLVLSDGEVPAVNGECSDHKQSCLLRGCYMASQICDGNYDCEDRIDERDCSVPHAHEHHNNNLQKLQKSRTSRHFSSPWLWREVVIGSTGVESSKVRIPPGVAHLVLTAFSLHAVNGLSVLQNPIMWEGSRGFYMTVEAPRKVAMWEQVGVRVTAVNHHRHPIEAIIVLANNPKYMFVDVEFDPIDPSIRKQHRRSGREHEHTVSVGAGETHTLHLPIQPVTLGKIVVIVQASVMGKKTQEEVELFVEPPGAMQENHTSLLVDLSNRAYSFTFLDSPVPAGHETGYVQVHLALCGGSVGPVQPSIPPTATSVLGLPSTGIEPTTFSFLMTVGQMEYWKEMKQEPPLDEKVLYAHLEQLYQTLLSFRERDGGFKYYKSSNTSSVWVTSVVVRTLNTAARLWPHLLYIDPQVNDNAIRFLLDQQAPHGAWCEPGGVAVENRNLVPPQFSLTETTTYDLNLTTTAMVILSLTSLQDLPTPLDTQVLTAISKGSSWLSGNLKVMESSSTPLEISLAALALHLSSSPHALEAFHILSRNAREEVSYIYWGEDRAKLPTWRVESQRSHLQPRHTDIHDAGNVASTAYALRLYCLRRELRYRNIVNWLNSQRSHDEGWRSTQDTLVAWEALRECSKMEEYDRDRSLTVQVEPMADSSKSHTFYVSPDNLLHLQKHQIDAGWKSIRVQGRGHGLAILQLTTRSYVTQTALLTPPPTPAFDLTSHASYRGRNGSSIVFKTCMRWIFKHYSHTIEASGATVLEIAIPTGYGASEQDFRHLVDSGTVPYLRRAEITPRLATFYFEKVTTTNTCLEFKADRWFPVANLSTVLPVKVYEYYSPEMYETHLLDISSVNLDICEICGSYQCPNCPILSYFSSPASPLPHLASPCLILVIFNVMFEAIRPKIHISVMF